MVYKKRKEFCLLLSDRQADEVLQVAEQAMQATRSSMGISDKIYDSPSSRLRSCASDLESRQYRIRRIGQSWDALLQRRTQKRRGITLRQEAIPTHQLADLHTQPLEPARCGHWFAEQIHDAGLSPAAMLHFERTAIDAQTLEGPIRLSVDRNVVAESVGDRQLPCASTRHGQSSSQSESINLLKMRYFVALPAAFKHLIYEFKFLPAPVSLYGLAATEPVEPLQPDTGCVQSSLENRMPSCQIG